MGSLNKKAYRRIKKLVGEQRSRRWNIAARRAAFRLKIRPSVKPKHVVHIAGQGVYVSGNIIDLKGKLTGLELLLDDGQCLDLMPNMVRFSSNTLFGISARGPNQLPAGFSVYAKYPKDGNTSCEPVGLRLRLRNGKVIDQKLTWTDSNNQPLQHVQKILAKVPAESDAKRDMFDTLFGPAVQAIWQSRDVQWPTVEEQHYNKQLAIAEPDVSIIVPIYGRYDFIEYQLSSFIRDPDMGRHELIYVIDDPRLLAEVRMSCDALSRIYPIPFRVLFLERNMGYAGANNIGVSHARGVNVLLLNSDVMPAAPGWLRLMLDTVGDSLATSITGARLLYEDSTVQHDGMKFFASPFMNDLWTNIHPGKGMPLDVFHDEASLVPREAVTGACLLMTRENYTSLQGLNEQYILGDFEDSDLCLAARRQGLTVQLAPAVQLFHLERLSQSLVAADRWKQEVTYFNCWQHHGKWHSDIVSMKQETQLEVAYG